MQAGFLHQKPERGYPPLPPDETLREAAYLIARGVRPLAILGVCAEGDALTNRHRLLALGQAGAVPFAIPTGEGEATCGYAGYAWAIDLLRWVEHAAPVKQRDRILGLLLGYAPAAIRSFEELSEGADR